MKNIKKIVLVLVLGIISLVFFGCTVNETQNVFTDSKDVIAFEAMSGVELLATGDEEMPLVGPVNDLVEESAVEEEVDVLNKYLGIMEKYLKTDNGLSISEEISDKEEYEK
ncbi:MAG: hypothetical protein PHU02_03015, partial [Bacilli bacterium]|nr:hypothetical protein [Bacilli bacterium]MDD5183120.1 hypothetical protein [Bacilli bacterium]